MKDTYKIVVRYDPPPIPTYNFDWSAVSDNYEPGSPIGFGNTPLAAISDLLEQLNNE